MDILEVIDKLKELDYDEITLDGPDFKLSLRRKSNGSPTVSVSQSPARIIDTVVNEVKEPGLASTKQVKYVRDVMVREFDNNDDQLINFEVPHPASWDDTLTVEMAEAILNDWERRQGIDKKR